MKEKLTIRQWKEDDRPRERMIKLGAESLSDAELIAVLFGSGTKNETAVDLGRTVINAAGNNLRSLTNMSIDSLKKIKGIGPTKALVITAVSELTRRISSEEVKSSQQIKSSEYAAKIISPVLRDLSHEECWVMYLNRANRLIAKERLSKGGVSATVVDVKIVVKNALEKLASSIILVHNHPSGNPTPGDADKVQTKALHEAASMFDITLLDHLIIAGDTYFSFSDQGLM